MNDPRTISTEGLTPETAEAIEVIAARLLVSTDTTRANAAAYSLSEAVTNLRAIGA